jgi:N6-adenosine-specific RNA methylase IME4
LKKPSKEGRGKTVSTELVKSLPLVNWDEITKAMDAAKDIEALNALRFRVGTIDWAFRAAKRIKVQRDKAILAHNKCLEYLVQIDRKRFQWMQENISKGGAPRSHKATLAQADCTKTEHQRLKVLGSIPQEEIADYFRRHNEAIKEANRSGVLHLYSIPPKQSPPLPDGKFRVILADPGWPYDYTPGKIKPPYAHYSTMPIEDICALGARIRPLRAPNCTLLLWVPPCKLLQGFKVLAAWGFEFATQTVWNKGGRDWGWYGNVVHENILIGRRGSGTPTTQDNQLIQSIDSIQNAPKTCNHSEKPVIYHEMIEKLWPGQKYVELFAREPEHRREGWTYWGNELEDPAAKAAPIKNAKKANRRSSQAAPQLHLVRVTKAVPRHNQVVSDHEQSS